MALIVISNGPTCRPGNVFLVGGYLRTNGQIFGKVSAEGEERSVGIDTTSVACHIIFDIAGCQD